MISTKYLRSATFRSVRRRLSALFMFFKTTTPQDGPAQSPGPCSEKVAIQVVIHDLFSERGKNREDQTLSRYTPLVYAS